MIFQRLGCIFDPSEHGLPDGCFGFSQSPQLLEFGEHVRIYFCTRSKEPDGMFRSHVAYADFSKDLSCVLRVSDSDVVPPAELGTFDEHGIFPINVIRVGEQVWGYTCGWNRRISVSVDTGIGLVVSDDGGDSFRRLGPGPLLGPSLYEPFLVGDAFVIRASEQFHMWYMFGQRWIKENEKAAPDRVYKIGHASSKNGIDWVKDEGQSVLPDRMGPDECHALPSVMFHGGLWHMVFCYRHVHGFRNDPDLGYKLGYASSTDLKTWTREDEALGFHTETGEWDSQMQCYPHLCKIDGQPYLLYNGNAFGRSGFGAARLSFK